MTEHIKKYRINAHSTKSTIYITDQNKSYAIPKNVVKKFIINNDHREYKPTKKINQLFEELDQKYTKAGALLKGLRARENLSQIAFAAKIQVTQANLSKMENGHRPIGKIIAKRIEKVFGTNYRYFLE